MNKKSIIIITIAIILSLGIGTTVGYFLFKDKDVKTNCAPKPAEEVKEKDKKSEKKPIEDSSNEPPTIEVEETDDYGLGSIESVSYYNSKFFIISRGCGADCPGEYAIYDEETQELVFKNIMGSNYAITKDNRVYACGQKISEYSASKQTKELNVLDDCLSIKLAKNNSNQVIAAGIKNKKLTFYDIENQKYKETNLTIDDTILPNMLILEPYNYDGEYDAYVGVGTTLKGKDDDSICKEYFYSVKNDSIKEFKTNCWGKLSE